MCDEIKQFFSYAWNNHRWQTLGALIGILLGISILVIGFIKTVFILLCLSVGTWCGRKFDKGENPFQSLLELDFFRQYKLK